MFKKHIIFQILYIIVGPLCPASLKRFVFYKVPPSDKHSLLWLASLTQCIVIGRTPQALRNVTPLSIIASFKFQNKSKDRDRNRVAWQTVMMLVCVYTQAVVKKADSTVMWSCLCPLSLAHTRAHTHSGPDLCTGMLLHVVARNLLPELTREFINKIVLQLKSYMTFSQRGSWSSST